MAHDHVIIDEGSQIFVCDRSILLISHEMRKPSRIDECDAGAPGFSAVANRRSILASCAELEAINPQPFLRTAINVLVVAKVEHPCAAANRAETKKPRGSVRQDLYMFGIISSKALGGCKSGGKRRQFGARRAPPPCRAASTVHFPSRWDCAPDIWNPLRRHCPHIRQV